MTSNLRVDQILPSVGTNVAIGTATGTVTLAGTTSGTFSGNLTGNVVGNVSGGTLSGISTLGVTTAYINTLSGISTISASSAISINQNLVFASGKGIDFSATANSSGTMTSELLSDYEEGTWIPVPNGVTIVSGSPTYVGTYTKIGRMVHASMFQTAGTITVAAGNYFTGLPFTPANYHNTGSWSCAATGKSGVSNIFNSNSAIYIQQLISTGTSLTQFITSGVYTV